MWKHWQEEKLKTNITWLCSQITFSKLNYGKKNEFRELTMLKRRMPKPHTVRGSALAKVSTQFGCCQLYGSRSFEFESNLYLWPTIHSGGAYTLVPSYLNSSSSTRKPPEPKSIRRILLVSRSTTRFSSFTSLCTTPRSWQAVTMSNTYK